MKDLMLKNKVITAQSISSIELNYSMIDKMYNVIARQYGNVCSLFSTPNQEQAQKVYNALIDKSNCIMVDDLVSEITKENIITEKKQKRPTKKKVDNDVK